MFSILWGGLVALCIWVDSVPLQVVKLLYVSLWLGSAVGVLLLKNWGRKGSILAAGIGVVLLLLFSVGTGWMVLVTGFAGFHMSPWGWVPWVGLALAWHVAYIAILTRPSVKAQFLRTSLSQK